MSIMAFMDLDRRVLGWFLVTIFAGLCAIIAIALILQKAVLEVSFLDVGQGDAILIEGPTGVNVLVDGGRDRSVLRELPKQLGFFDRALDAVVATHPDADHISGLSDVLERYRVSYVIDPGMTADTSNFLRLESAISEEQAERVLARSGQRLMLGGGAYADILYPDKDVSKGDTNDGSIIIRVVYGDTEFLLTGDAPSFVEDRLPGDVRSDVLKAGHHGSRTSTSAAFLAKVSPEVVIISAGKDNSYGHPHQDVLDRIAAAGAQALSTIEEGTIEFESDGTLVRQK